MLAEEVAAHFEEELNRIIKTDFEQFLKEKRRK